MMTGPLFGARCRLVTAVVGALASAACSPRSSTGVATVAPDPNRWAVVDCRSCKPANVVIEMRRSVDEEGRPGRYTYARVRNLNPHRVALTAYFTLAERSYPDQDIVVETRQLTLAGAGVSEADSVFLLQGRGGVAEASIHGVEKS